MPINVMIVDDSAFMRKVLSDMLSSDPNINIIAKLQNGAEAVKQAAKLDPDVITMDVNMPEMDGLSALTKIMADSPRPVVMVAASQDHEMVVKCLEAGAVDFMVKPSGEISLDMKTLESELILKVKTAATAKIKHYAAQKIEHRQFYGAMKKIVVIASSTGGPQTLEHVIPLLPGNIPACVLCVQHMPPGFTKSLAERFSHISELVVKEAEDGDEILPGKVLIAPGDYHMEVKREITRGFAKDIIRLNKEEKECGVRPSANWTMRSVAEIYGERVIGVVLTGMGSDGTDGARKIKEYGGTVLAQDKESCIIYGMPKCVIEAGYYDEIVPLSKLPVALVQILEL
ncbi:MAG: chemotaxis response regulator protein-glutamate methylesterase [archaeon]